MKGGERGKKGIIPSLSLSLSLARQGKHMHAHKNPTRHLQWQVEPKVPTNNALSTKFLLSSDAEIVVDKHRLSMQVGTQTCEKRMCNVHIFRLGFHFAHHRWWLGFEGVINTDFFFWVG